METKFPCVNINSFYTSKLFRHRLPKVFCVFALIFYFHNKLKFSDLLRFTREDHIQDIRPRFSSA